MLSFNSKLLIKDVKDLKYSFVPQSNYWRGISTRFNQSQKIVTVSRIKLIGNISIARVEQFYSFPHDNEKKLLREDVRNVSFVDKDFAKKLRTSV